jgi:hypothetical protein
MARIGIATVAVFVAWMLLDILLHGMLLRSSYALTPQLWRPMGEFKVGLNAFVVLVSAACFVWIYAQFVSDKSLKTALLYAAVFGLWRGITMGYGSYAVMPMPYLVALAWFLGAIVEVVVGGAILGWIVRNGPDEA